MDQRNLTEAWEAMEAQENLMESKKKIKEEGTMTTAPASEAEGQFKQKLGKKVNETAKPVDPKKVATAAKLGAGVAGTDESETVGAAIGTSMTNEEQLPDEPLPPGAEDIMGGESEGMEDPVAATQDIEDVDDVTTDAPTEDASIDAENAEHAIAAIQAKYPNAVITISVELPEDQFDTSIVAAAQEVTGSTDETIGGDESIEDTNPTDIEADLGDEENAPLNESRKVVIKKKRKQIREMFENLEGDELTTDETEPVAADVGTEEAPVATEVNDNKITLTPEQWAQVVATSELLNVDTEVPGDEAALDVDASAEVAPETDEEVVDENIVKKGKTGKPVTHTILDLDRTSDAPAQEPSIRRPTTTIDPRAIKKDTLKESFNAELAGYADALRRLL
jgi:hypothetical protein